MRAIAWAIIMHAMRLKFSFFRHIVTLFIKYTHLIIP